jgi:hypothetical protein
LLIAVLASVVALAAPALAAPKAEPWPRWEAHDPASTATIDHAAWQRFVAANVVAGSDGVNRIAYGRVRAADRRALETYIAMLSATPIGRHRRDEQRAFWINLYNAATVKLILDRYPLESILKLSISPGWFSVGPWGKKLLRVEGVDLSLDDIEHRILRPIWRDPRIHYAVNCASIGCPNLRREAYTAANVDGLLTRAARDYVNNWRGANFVNGQLFVSSIYKWYRADFGDSNRAVIDHLRAYAAPALAARLATVNDVAGHQYDWTLNDQAVLPDQRP